jgi:ATP adenylyltransferase
MSLIKTKKDIYYAPWRQKYFNDPSKVNSKDSKTCVFCNIKKEDSKLLVLESKHCFIQANKFPYGGGHLLVIPKRHVNTIIELTSKERKELFNLMDLATFALDIYLKPEGYNIGCSVGRVAGESISHLHFHILPRFQGDVGWNQLCNFNVISTDPNKLTKDIIKIIKKEKLIKKFDILE